MNYDFLADESDKIELLNFIFQQTDLQVFDLGSHYGEEITRYKTTEEIISKFDLRNGDKFAVTFQLWSPRLKGEIIFRRIALDPKRCNGHTFRYATDGAGLIQLYFGGLQNNELNRSHIGHQSEKRVQALSKAGAAGEASKWDWKEIEKVGRELKYHVHNKMAIRKIGSVGVLPGADKLEGSGVGFR